MDPVISFILSVAHSSSIPSFDTKIAIKMGQRHQLFVIARINGKYRCLAAVHHQWLYGYTAARQCLEILKIFSSSLNGIALQEELKLASTYSDDFWERGSRTDYSDASLVPRFPFIMTCLFIGAGFEQSRGYQHKVQVEPWLLEYDEGDNNNGITIFDITDPSTPRYCFVDFFGMESELQVQLMSPLDAGTWLRAYEKAHEFPDYNETWGKWQLIGTSALQDTWPSGKWQEPWQDQVLQQRDENSDDPSNDVEASEMSRSTDAAPETLGGGEPEHEDSRAATQEQDHNENESVKDFVGPSSLRSRTLTSLAEAFVRDGELDEEALSKAQMLPDFWPAVKAALYKDADGLKSTPKTRELLYQSLKEDRDVDVGPFTTVSIPDLAIVLDRLSHDGKMQSLNLSSRPTLTKHELEIVIKHTEKLQTLYLMGEPGSLSITDLTGLKVPGDVYHHVLLEQALRPLRDENSEDGEAGSDMLQFIPEQHSVRHIAYVTISAQHLPASGIDWSHLTLEHSGPTRGYLDQQVDRGMQCHKYPLTDTPMPLSRLVIGIRNLLEWLSKGSCFLMSEMAHVMASSFALGSSAQDSDPVNVGVGPLSNELCHAMHDCRALRLAPREWSLVIIHPGPGRYPPVIDFQVVEGGYKSLKTGGHLDHKNKVYYAFVKCHGDHTDLSIHDLRGFLKDVGGKQADQLAALSAAWPGFHYYDRSDIGEALQKIFV